MLKKLKSNWNAVKEMDARIGCLLLFITIFLISISAWIQHLYTCFTDERWGFLIAGAILAPIAVIHGLGIWVGIW